MNIKRGEPEFIEISIAEATTIQLEFTALSRASNNSKYEVKDNSQDGRNQDYISMNAFGTVIIIFWAYY